MKKALIAMSGGVDSSVAAYAMIEKGYECVGVTMRLYTNEDAGISRENSCCSLDDVEAAKRVAAKLGFPHYTMNFTAAFKEQVIDRFICAYENGCTPNPCIDCNRYIKFEALYQKGKEIGCDICVTGHYARIKKEGDRYLLCKAKDQSKDQSYVLYAMTQEQLAHTQFPLGEIEKTETRQVARQAGMANADKPDSQDICFVPDGDYAKVIENQTKKTYAPGNFVNEQGEILGQHKGIIHYTIGQRKGLGIAAKAPLYVKRIDVEKNEVILSDNEALFESSLLAGEMNWIFTDTPPESFRATARIRYHQKEQEATVYVQPDGNIRVDFDQPQRAITKGQAIVLYQGEVVLGGGRIISCIEG